MKLTGVMFTGQMVRAIKAGEKIQTRRLVRLNDAGRVSRKGMQWHPDDPLAVRASPYGQRGDLIWVRESWAKVFRATPTDPGCVYRADDDGRQLNPGAMDGRWKPSMFMPRAASRLTLELTAVRIERLHAISYNDSLAEGIAAPETEDEISAQDAYRELWLSINGPGSWEKNPRVWVLTFKVHHCNVARFAVEQIGLGIIRQP